MPMFPKEKPLKLLYQKIERIRKTICKPFALLPAHFWGRPKLEQKT